jgi:hypothetical protein
VILFGTQKRDSASKSIPVEWNDLSDSFDINVTPDDSGEYDGFDNKGGEDEPFWPYGNPNDDIPEQY